MTAAAIDATELTKDYGNGRGCSGVTIAVEEGEAFGFLGPNGAGKSTFVKMLVGLIGPTSGRATIFGEPVGTLAAKRKIGYLPELYRYQEWLSGAEVMRLHAKLCGVEAAEAARRIPQLLEEVGLGARGRDRVKHYSKGMQQRLGLACALVNDPAVVFLDEPSSALDPLGRMDVRQLLQRLKRQGKTLFLNSHLLEDVEMVCDRVALLNNGRIVRSGTVTDVLQAKTRWRFRVGGFTPLLLDWLREATAFSISVAGETAVSIDAPAMGAVPSGGVRGATGAPVSVSAEPPGDSVWLEAELENEEQVGWINSLLIGQGCTLYEVMRVTARLEEWFVSAVAGLEHRGERG